MGADTREGVSVHCEKCQSNSAKRLAPPGRGPRPTYPWIQAMSWAMWVDLNVVTFL